jgi:hypothetical protein
VGVVRAEDTDQLTRRAARPRARTREPRPGTVASAPIFMSLGWCGSRQWSRRGCKLAAISALEAPLATSTNTSCSRGVSSSSRTVPERRAAVGLAKAEMTRRVMAGANRASAAGDDVHRGRGGGSPRWNGGPRGTRPVGGDWWQGGQMLSRWARSAASVRCELIAPTGRTAAPNASGGLMLCTVTPRSAH